MPREFVFEVALTATVTVNSYGDEADALAAKHAGNVVRRLKETATEIGCGGVEVLALDATVNRGATGTGSVVFEHGEGEQSFLVPA